MPASKTRTSEIAEDELLELAVQLGTSTQKQRRLKAARATMTRSR